MELILVRAHTFDFRHVAMRIIRVQAQCATVAHVTQQYIGM